MTKYDQCQRAINGMVNVRKIVDDFPSISANFENLAQSYWKPISNEIDETTLISYSMKLNAKLNRMVMSINC